MLQEPPESPVREETLPEAPGKPSGLSSFNESYRGVPPWDIGRPQPAFAQLAASENLGEDIVDVGCGTGEHAILFASMGYRALGVDSAPLAIEKARAKASQRGSNAKFIVADALHLESLNRQFDAAVDSALFHVFSDRDREAYVDSLRAVLRPGGRYYMLCFSNKEPVGWGGPRRVFKREILKSFSDGWRVNYVRPAKIETAFHEKGGEGWFSKVTKA